MLSHAYIQNGNLSQNVFKNLECWFWSIFKKGFHDRSNATRDQVTSPVGEIIGSNTDWLSWIQPSLLQQGQKRWENCSIVWGNIKRVWHTIINLLLYNKISKKARNQCLYVISNTCTCRYDNRYRLCIAIIWNLNVIIFKLTAFHLHSC